MSLDDDSSRVVALVSDYDGCVGASMNRSQQILTQFYPERLAVYQMLRALFSDLMIWDGDAHCLLPNTRLICANGSLRCCLEMDLYNMLTHTFCDQRDMLWSGSVFLCRSTWRI